MADEFKHKDVGTALTEVEWEGIDTHILDGQATGDIIYASSGTQLSRLGKGSDGDVLTLASGIPSWAATAGTAAADLTGTTLASNVVSSSLTTVGTLTTLTVDNVIINDVNIGHTSDTDLMTLASGGLTVSGTITVGVDDAGHDVKFFGDTASRYWLWDTDADGVVQRGTLTVGVDDTGHDVKFFGASAGAYLEWDESEDQLKVMGASADATTSTGKLLLATSLTDINANDVLGKVEFQAPLEAGGTDAITVASAIEAVAQDTFSASVNATDLIFKTGHSEAATEKFRITSQGELGVGGANYGTDGQVLTSGGAGVAPAWEDAGGGGGGAMEFISKTTLGSDVATIDFTGFTTNCLYKLVGKKILMDGSGHVRLKPFLNGGGSVSTGVCDWVVDRPFGCSVYTDYDYYEFYTYGYEDDYFEFMIDFSTDTYGWLRGPGHPSGNTSNPNGYCYLYGHLNESNYSSSRFSGFQLVNGSGNNFLTGSEFLLYKIAEA